MFDNVKNETTREKYIKAIEKLVNVKIMYISVGPKRQEMIKL